MKQKKRKEELRKLWQSQEWFDEFQNETDRGAALLGAAFADAVLETTLRAFFVDDEEQADFLLNVTQPLGGFGSRIRLAYCLGLITKSQFSDLLNIAKIRNEFAHRIHSLDFSSPEITALCANLLTPRDEVGANSTNMTSRDLFICAVVLVCSWIRIRQLGIPDRKERRSVPEKPRLATLISDIKGE